MDTPLLSSSTSPGSDGGYSSAINPTATGTDPKPVHKNQLATLNGVCKSSSPAYPAPSTHPTPRAHRTPPLFSLVSPVSLLPCIPPNHPLPALFPPTHLATRTTSPHLPSPSAVPLPHTTSRPLLPQHHGHHSISSLGVGGLASGGLGHVAHHRRRGSHGHSHGPVLFRHRDQR